jgi:hypothetical protein
MSIEGELEKWRRQWQSGAANAAEPGAAQQLRRRVLRETRWLKLSLVFPILVTVGVGGLVILRALRAPQTVEIVLAVETWIFIAVVWAAALWVARGTWRPLADTTAAFVAVSIHRREANLRGATLGACLYVFQLLFIVVFLGFVAPGGIGAVVTSPHVIVVGWVGVPIGLAWLHWFRQRQRAELEHLRELERQLKAD